MDIIEAIKERRSVRSYNGEGLTDSQKATLMKAIEESYSPFGGKLTIRLKEFDLKEGYRPGTYGMIKGANYFFLLGIGSDEASALTAGFQFEQVVLNAWQMGLGTCWIAGTFRCSDFDKGESWPEGVELRIVCPVGGAVKPTIKESITRMALGSKNRKPFDKLFFYGDFSHSVATDNRFAAALEMLRLAPSSTNSQPWRALVDDDTVHFYYKPKSETSVLDCGIGICHFYLTEKYHGHIGGFSKEAKAPVPPDDWKYLISYKSE